MVLNISEQRQLDKLEKKLKKRKVLSPVDREEYDRLVAKKAAPSAASKPVSVEAEVLPKVENNSKSSIKYTISVDSEEKREKIQAALDDIEEYRRAEKKKIDDEIILMRNNAEKEIQQNAIQQTDAACKEIISAANKDAEKIKKAAREQAEKDSEEFVKQAEQKSIEAEEAHKEYIGLLAKLNAQKIDYRNEALKDIERDIIKITTEKDNLLSEISRYKDECEDLKRKEKQLEQDLSEYEKVFGQLSEGNGQLLSLKKQLEFMDDKYKKLVELLDERTADNIMLMDRLNSLGVNPEETQKTIDYLRSRVEELQAQIDYYPSNWEQIVQDSNQLEIFRKKCDDLSLQIQELRNEKFELEIKQTELEDYRKFVKILELQRDELKAELDRNIAQYESRSGKIFASLSEIDSEKGTYPVNKRKKVDLKALCDDFRSYLNCRDEDRTSNKSPLYYDKSTIRTFIAGFASSRTMILEGLSGTGKTSLPVAFADYMNSVTEIVPVQSSWKDKNDLLGFYNDFKKEYVETDFLKYLYKAANDRDNIHIIILDEMNISRIEYYFADLLSKLELTEGRKTISLIPNAISIIGKNDSWPSLIDKGELEIPDNVWFIGTANKDDSTFTITDKVYDRSVVISFNSKGKRDDSLSYVGPASVHFEDFKLALKATEWSAKNKDRAEFDRKMEDLEKLLEPFDITFGNRIYRQLERFVPAYMACGGTMTEAIDVMFSLKIIRKLEGLYDDRTKSNLEKLETELRGYPLSQARVRSLSLRIA